MANVDKSKNCLGLLNHFERVKGLERNLKNSSPTKLLEFCPKKKKKNYGIVSVQHPSFPLRPTPTIKVSKVRLLTVMLHWHQ